MPINTGETDTVHIANLQTCWGGETVHLSAEEAATYQADPDAFAAKHFGLTTSEYLEWLDTQGAPLCGALTAKGKPCKSMTGGYQLRPTEWKARHRETACASHS